MFINDDQCFLCENEKCSIIWHEKCINDVIKSIGMHFMSSNDFIILCKKCIIGFNPGKKLSRMIFKSGILMFEDNKIVSN